MTDTLVPGCVFCHVRPLRHTSNSARRGVLLLVVLSMLTLFLMLGAAFLVTTSRARDSARAFARLTFGGDEARIPHARLLDTVLLRVVRGGVAPIATGANAPPVRFESILGDKYGVNTLTGNVTSWAVNGPIMTATASLPLVCPTDLVGRVLTFTAPGRPVTSHRIIRAVPASGSGNGQTSLFTLFLDIPVGARPVTTSTTPSPVIVNGREFAGIPAASAAAAPSNESWDGFDFHNPFLAQIGPGSFISTSVVARVSYSGTSAISGAQLAAVSTTGTGLADYDGDLIPDIADNDNDGTPDGLFLDYGLPDSVDAFGNPVQVRASVLVVDLDGRFNVNAHDGLARIVYGGTANWPLVASGSVVFSGSTPTGYSAPLGSGYGPAEVNGAFMFVNSPPNAPLVGATNAFSSTAENPTLFAMTGGPALRLTGTRAGTAGSRYTNGQSTPRLLAMEGKYGERAAADWTNVSGTSSNTAPFQNANPGRFARPGQPSVDDPISQISDRRAVSGTGSAQSLSYGVPPIWWTGSNAYNWAVTPTIGGGTQPLPRGVFNSPPDLHGRMRTTTGTTTGIVPQMRFARVEWANANSGITAVQEGMDDPYELRLDTRRGFGGLLFDPTAGGSGTNSVSIARDNPFTPAELEPVLRPYDIDTNRLPPRLAAMLGSVAEESRLKITTDSWDTTAITGTAATLIFGLASGTTGWLQQVTGQMFSTNPLNGVIGGEVARGDRFDLNRPLAASDTTADSIAYPGSAAAFASGTYHQQRQAYFKDFYTLLVALNPSVPAATLAQWAANVVEFRDGDSRIIPYEYDTNPADGWAPDGYVGSDEGGDRKVVWGAERPEIVIQEAFAWRNTAASVGATGTAGIVITLHRPWNARAYTGTSGTVSIAAEPCDVAFDTFGSGSTPAGTGAPLDQVDLGKQCGPTVYSGTGNVPAFNAVTSSTFPIWRLRIVGSSTTLLRLDTSGTWASNEVAVPSVTNGTTKPRLPADSTLTISTTTTIAVGPAPTTGTATLVLTGSSRLAPQLRPGTASSLMVYLERLSDPTQTLNATATVPGTSVTGSTVWLSDPLSGADSATVPVRYIVVDAVSVSVVDTGIAASVPVTSTRRTANNPPTSFWQPGTASATGGSITAAGSLSFPTPVATGTTAWLPWPNRPFASAAELMLVPQGSALEILQNYRKLTPSLSGSVGLGRGVPIPLEPLFEAAYVPTRFAGIHATATTSNAAAALASVGVSAVTTPVHQLSSFREPGRVNLNTVAAIDVWNAVVAGALPGPVTTATAAGFGLGANPTPATSLFQLLTLSGIGNTVVSDTTPTFTVVTAGGTASLPMSTLNPLHEIYTATRLANTVTPRSNVFGIWITLRESVPNDPDSVRYRRAFYIVDRSIPVGYEAGKDYNVWDTVRLRRIVE